METMRRPFQGVNNIMRFNWPFYVLSFGFVLALICYSFFTDRDLQLLLQIGATVFVLPIVASLAISFYVYDLSGLYNLNWLPNEDTGKKILNINAGFDETSSLLQRRYPSADLMVLDFYDPQKHTEPSIKRARNTYPPYKGTKTITTGKIHLEKESVDTIYVVFAAHEIRDEEERIIFFKEIRRILKPKGQVVVAEHLRDLPNFLAYTLGFFHFLPMSSWTHTFSNSGFRISEQKKHTPFVNIFTLSKHGNTF
jgi:SAM-dependent methyltransferase